VEAADDLVADKRQRARFRILRGDNPPTIVASARRLDAVAAGGLLDRAADEGNGSI
jgi:hypothetical protein